MAKKIGFYINCISKGGAERVMIQLAHHFEKIGYKVVLITSFYMDDEYKLPDNVRRYSLEEKQDKDSRVRRNVRLIYKLRKFCIEERIDVLISFMQEPNFRAIVATRGIETKVVVSVRNDPNKEYAGRIGRFVGKKILPIADGCVFQTEQAKEWFPLKLQENSKIILNEVAEKFFETEREDVDLDSIVSVGRLSRQKNHGVLIKAFAEIVEEYPKKRLFIYGAGELKDELVELIKSKNLEEKVYLMGTIDSVEAILSVAGMFILSSDYEGMPNALMEAMAVGVPCISTNCPCGGPAMLIRNNIDGILVEPNDINGLANAMKTLFSNKDYALSMGAVAKERAKMFRSDVVFNEWKSYLETFL